MKRTITIIRRTEEKIERDIELPIYRKYDLEDHIIYSRINEDLSAVDITDRGNEMRIEWIPKYRFDGSPENYHLGQGAYESSREEFEATLNKLRAFVDRQIPPRQ